MHNTKLNIMGEQAMKDNLNYLNVYNAKRKMINNPYTEIQNRYKAAKVGVILFLALLASYTIFINYLYA